MEELLPPGLALLIIAAKEIRDKKIRQANYINQLQQSKRTNHLGKSRVTAPEVFDYGTVIEDLCDALEYYEKHQNDSYKIE